MDEFIDSFDLARDVPCVLRRAENIEEAEFIAQVYRDLPERGFRVPRPIPTRDGQWVSADGWTAWTLVDGFHAGKRDVPASIRAIRAFHAALVSYPKPAYLDERSTIYDRADRAAWSEQRGDIDRRLAAYMVELERLWRPIEPQPCQLIHGDLNESNILIATGMPPAIIDFTPYWRPVNFALAVFAYWLGPYQADAGVLDAFADIPDFDQLLIRVAMRTVLIMHEFIREGGDAEHIEKEFGPPVRTIVQWMHL